MRNANEEFLSESEMREIEDIMAARYQLNTEVCQNFSHVRLLSKPNGRFLKRLRCVDVNIVFNSPPLKSIRFKFPS